MNAKVWVSLICAMRKTLQMGLKIALCEKFAMVYHETEHEWKENRLNVKVLWANGDKRLDEKRNSDLTSKPQNIICRSVFILKS